MPAPSSERRYFGKIKTVNTNPPSVTIVPEDRLARPDNDTALGLSRVQIVEFLKLIRVGKIRVSYVLSVGARELLVQDVRSEEAIVEVKGEDKKEEVRPSEAANVKGEGEGKGRGKKGSSVSSRGGSKASRPDRITLEEEAKRNARGEFRNRMGGSPTYVSASKEDEWNVGGRAERG